MRPAGGEAPAPWLSSLFHLCPYSFPIRVTYHGMLPGSGSAGPGGRGRAGRSDHAQRRFTEVKETRCALPQILPLPPASALVFLYVSSSRKRLRLLSRLTSRGAPHAPAPELPRMVATTRSAASSREPMHLMRVRSPTKRQSRGAGKVRRRGGFRPTSCAQRVRLPARPPALNRYLAPIPRRRPRCAGCSRTSAPTRRPPSRASCPRRRRPPTRRAPHP